MKRSKKGSYLVEASLSLPVFIIAVMLLSSVILMYACIEDLSFITANEIRRSAAEAIAADTSFLLPYRLKKAYEDDHSRVRSVRTKEFGWRTSRWGQDELILIRMRVSLGSPDKIGIRPRADHDISLVTRAYVGKIRDIEAMSEAEMAGDNVHPVYIFPKRGEKYHSMGCPFLTASYRSASLNYSIRSEYSSCPLCRSGRAGSGTTVYYFPAAGEAYHLAGCPALQRNYIEVDIRDAKARGYTPCAKCGG